MSLFNTMKTLAKAWIIENAIKSLSVENVRKILNKCLTFLVEKSNETENVLDDWAVEAITYIFNDETKLNIITDFVKSKLAGNICQDIPESETPDWEPYNQLVHTLLDSENTDGHECQSGSIFTLLSMIFRIVIPAIIEALQEQKEG